MMKAGLNTEDSRQFSLVGIYFHITEYMKTMKCLFQWHAATANTTCMQQQWTDIPPWERYTENFRGTFKISKCLCAFFVTISIVKSAIHIKLN